MRTIELLQRQLNSDCFPDLALHQVVGKGKHWNVSRLVSRGELQRVRRGLFVFGPDYRKQPLNLMPIANILYGPSYVSLDWALSYHQLIPERVVEVTSVTLKRTKYFRTPIGRFSYRKIPSSVFPMDLIFIEGAFLIASPEKALVDKLYLDAPRSTGLDYCCENLRIELSRLSEVDRKAMVDLGRLYRNKTFAQQIERLTAEIEKHG
jgi:predicted transcriptional regulator of viral defense system